MSKPRSLTPKQAAFVAEYLVDLNATQASIRAGYSAKTAMWQGPQLLRIPHVVAAVKAAKRKLQVRVEVTQDEVIRELRRIAFGDPRDVMRWGKKGVQLRESGELSDDQAAAIAEVGETTAGLRVKKHDKVKALELLGKHLGIFVERQELTGKNGAPLPAATVIAGVTAEQLADAVHSALAKV